MILIVKPGSCYIGTKVNPIKQIPSLQNNELNMCLTVSAPMANLTFPLLFLVQPEICKKALQSQLALKSLQVVCIFTYYLSFRRTMLLVLMYLT